MSAASDYLELKLLDHSLGTAGYSAPSTVYVGLFVSTVDAATTLANLEAGTLTDEISGNSYARQSIAFGAASAGSATNSGSVTFPTASGTWGTITHLAVIDASSSGNVIYAGALDSSKLIETGDTFVIQASNLTITLA